MPIIPALRRQRQVELLSSRPGGLQSEFQNSPDYKEKPCIEYICIRGLNLFAIREFRERRANAYS